MGQAEDFRCPNCGAPLAIEGDRPTIRCPFCSTQVIVPPELRPKPPEAVQTGIPFPVPPLPPDAVEPVRRKRTAAPLGCLLVFAGLIVLGMIGQALRSVSPGDGSSAVNFVQTATPTAQPIQRPLESDLPRTLNYAGFTIQITQGVIDNQIENGDKVTFAADQAFARLKATLTNTTKENLFLDAQLFKLKLADGKFYPLGSSTILNNTFTAPDPGSTSSTTLIFEVPVDAAWEGGELVVGSGDSEPADMPLTGGIPPQPYPHALGLPAETKAAAQGMDYQLLGAAVDLDSGSHRAAKGSRYLSLNMRMTNTGGQYGLNLSPDLYRLVIDGVSQAPITAPIEVVPYQASTDGEVVFVVPAQSGQATLQVGDVRSDTNQFGSLPLDLSSQ